MEDKAVSTIEFPIWIPKEAQRIIRPYLESPDSYEKDFNARIRRFISDKKMESVWRQIKKYSKRGQDITHFTRFALIEIPHNWRLIRPNPDELKIKAITKIVSNRRIMISESTVIATSINRRAHIKRQIRNIQKLIAGIGFNYPFMDGPPREYLTVLNQLERELRIFVPRSKNSNEIFPESANFKRKKERGADQRYYIRELANLVLRIFGTPLYQTVATTANVVFGTTTMTKERVIQNTRDIRNALRGV